MYKVKFLWKSSLTYFYWVVKRKKNRVPDKNENCAFSHDVFLKLYFTARLRAKLYERNIYTYFVKICLSTKLKIIFRVTIRLKDPSSTVV